MLCKKPFRQGAEEFGCGQCMPCRINRKRLWTGRLLLESTLHRHSCFVTLTYDETHLPKDNSLSVPHYQQFIKRLRRVTNKKIVYYIVGEYGDTTVRPHYHAVLFGIHCPEGLIERKKINNLNLYWSEQKLLARCWTRGNIHVGTVTPFSLQYSCGHLTKAMTKSTDPRLNGKYPEFARMSLKPAIGKNAIQPIANWHLSKEGSKYVEKHGDVINAVRIDGKLWPLGQYLTRELRRAVGLPDRPTDKAKRIRYEKTIEEIKQNGYEFKNDARKRHSAKANAVTQIQNIRRSL